MIALIVVAAFLLGSIPFGVIVARGKGVDLRERGSGNIGATNAARVLGARAGAIVLLLDASKGAVAAWLGMLFGFTTLGWPLAHDLGWLPAVTGFAAILGHCFSPFLDFRGGKGVATALGVFLVLAPALAAVAVGVFLVVAGRVKVVAVGSLAGIAAATIAAFVIGEYQALCVATLVLITVTHRRNIAGLFAARI